MDILKNTHQFYSDVPFYYSGELSNLPEKSLQNNSSKIVSEENNSNLDPDLSKKIKYHMNNVGQRSEDFNVLDTSKTNILFAGCSVTFGEYLPEGYSWPHHVYSAMKSANENLGPLNIVSFPGASCPKIVSNIFKYVDSYGTPDYIFVLLPDMFRYYEPQSDGGGFFPAVTYLPGTEVEDENFPFKGMYEFQQHYRMLETLCKVAGIKLFATSWENMANEKMMSLGFNYYGKLDYSDMDRFVKGLDMSKLDAYDKDFILSAADNVHPGLLTQKFYAQHFIDRLSK